MGVTAHVAAMRRAVTATVRFLCGLVCFGWLAVGVVVPASAGEDAPASPGVPYALSAEALEALVGKTATVRLRSGRSYDGVELVKLRQGRRAGTLAAVVIRQPKRKRPRTIRAGAVAAIEVDGAVYAVAPGPRGRGYVLIDVAAQRQALAQKLKHKGGQLWRVLSPAEQAQAVREHKDYIQRVLALFPDRRFQVVETNYFLFVSDIDPRLIRGYVRDLDAMYVMLTGMFQLPKGVNIFRGKAVVFCFSSLEARARFEHRFLNGDPRGTAGKCYQVSNGDVIISAHLGSDLDFFGHVLVHETAHGVIHRYLSSVRVPSWLNEGIADWVAMKIVPRCKETQRRQKAAAQRLRRTGTLEGMFFADAIEAWQYGAASAIVQLLIELDNRRFGAFFEAIKRGTDWVDALQTTYGMTVTDLCALYAKRLGIPLLRP